MDAVALTDNALVMKTYFILKIALNPLLILVYPIPRVRCEDTAGIAGNGCATTPRKT
jgi:hypothetical protein